MTELHQEWWDVTRGITREAWWPYFVRGRLRLVGRDDEGGFLLSPEQQAAAWEALTAEAERGDPGARKCLDLMVKAKLLGREASQEDL